MSLDNAINFAKVTVSTGYNSSATSIVLNAGQGALLPTAPFNVVWWNATSYPDPSNDPSVEIVSVTNVSTDTHTVTRAQESTSASNKNTGGATYQMLAGLTAKVINTDIPANFVNITTKVDLTAQSANIGSTNIIASTAAAGMYRISIHIAVTRAATTSSTLPSVSIGYTEQESSASISGIATGTSTGNSTSTTISRGEVIASCAANTAITYSTSGYLSSGATSMQYSVHIRLEYLG